MSLRVSGINPLSYIGVEPLQPPDLVYIKRNPISGSVPNADYRQFNVGTFWLNPSNQTLWILVSKLNNSPFWLQCAVSATGLLNTLTTDDMNIVTPLAMNINLFGDSNITTVGAIAHEAQITLNPNITVNSVTTNTLTVNNNATIAGNLTVSSLGAGVVQTNSGGLFSSTSGTDGQVLISSSTGVPQWNTITAGAGISIANGHNTITITNTGGGGGGLSTLTGNDGIAVSPSGGTILVQTKHSTVEFLNTGGSNHLYEEWFDSTNFNLIQGSSAVSTLTSGQGNTGYGASALNAVNEGGANTALGNDALANLTLGNNNTALGAGALENVIGGSSNIGIGLNAGTNLTTTSNNIAIGNAGNVIDSGAIRIGTNGTHTSNYQQGIAGVSVSNLNVVTINTATGQLGSQASSGGGATMVTVITNSGTWTKPAGAQFITVIGFAAGGGGASGGRGTSYSNTVGGVGGGGGGAFYYGAPAAFYGATENVVIGAGGTGGTAQTVDNSINGNSGVDGGSTSFGNMFAHGGQRGIAGNVNGSLTFNANSDFAPATGGTSSGGVSFGPGSNSDDNDVYTAIGASSAVGGQASGTGGGGGGAIGFAGGSGGNLIGGLGTIVSGGALGTAGNNGGNGDIAPTSGGIITAGTGGGGGGGWVNPNVGHGGTGGFPSGGGGGGGASFNGNASGVGGTGADGVVYVIVNF